MSTTYEIPVPLGESLQEQSEAVSFAVVEKATGRILYSGNMPKFLARMQLRNPEKDVLVWKELPISGHYYDLQADRLVQLPTSPSSYHEYDWDTKAFVYADDAKQRIWEDLKAQRDARMENGGVQVAGHWFNTNAMSRSKYQGIAASGIAVANWRTIDNETITMDSALAIEVLAAIAANDSSTFEAAAAQRAQMEQAENPTLFAVATGWPDVHRSFTG